MEQEDKIKCPKCGSTQIHAGQKGFSTGKAVLGTIVANPVVGALSGSAGSNKVIITCLACGCEFKPGEQLKKADEPLPKGVNVAPLDSITPKYITCPHCSKLSSMECTECPKCGRKFMPEDYDRATEIKSKASGCLTIVIIGIIISSLFSLIDYI